MWVVRLLNLLKQAVNHLDICCHSECNVWIVFTSLDYYLNLTGSFSQLHSSISVWNTMNLNSNIFLKPLCYNSGVYMTRASFKKAENSMKVSFKKAENIRSKIMWLCATLWMFNSLNAMIVKCWCVWSSLGRNAFGHNCPLTAVRRTKSVQKLWALNTALSIYLKIQKYDHSYANINLFFKNEHFC